MALSPRLPGGKINLLFRSKQERMQKSTNNRNTFESNGLYNLRVKKFQKTLANLGLKEKKWVLLEGGGKAFQD